MHIYVYIVASPISVVGSNLSGDKDKEWKLHVPTCTL